MAFLSSTQVLERLRAEGFNSSHFVWLLADVEYFEASNGWVFAFRRQGGVTLMALEPLGADTDRAGFAMAWRELAEAISPGVVAFVGVGPAFAQRLEGEGFQILKVGHEPWIRLESCVPKGNAGKGVRSARNQAIRAGLRVEEWSGASLAEDPARQAAIQEIYRARTRERLVNFSGFLDALDPLAIPRERRYFALHSRDRLEGVLVATPVPRREGYFLEDTMVRPDAPRGSGELLTIEAMLGLGASGAKFASLGVISMTVSDPEHGSSLPPLVHFATITLPKLFRLIYNTQGMEMFRKRFKPERWDGVYLAVRVPEGSSPTWGWFRALAALGKAFDPGVQLTPEWFRSSVWGPLQRFPVTAAVAALSLALSILVARSDGFLSAIARKAAKDFVYPDRYQFLTAGMAFFVLLYWAEKTQKKRFFGPVLALGLLLEPALNAWKAGIDGLGSSALLMTLLGFQLWQFRKSREWLFPSLILALAFVLPEVGRGVAPFHVHYLIYFSAGFLLGKAKFEHERRVSRRVAKGKSPVLAN